VDPPIWKLKVTLVGDRINVGLAVAAVMFKVTGMDCGEFDAPVLATDTDPV
jgi:hypothetical protein